LSGRSASGLGRLLRANPAERLVPPAGTRPLRPAGVLAAVLAFFAVLAMALALAAGRLVTTWDAGLAESATLQIIGDEPEVEAQARAALDVLRTTPGVRSVRMIEVDEQRALLEPWLGAGVALDGVPLPLLIAVEVDHATLDRTDLAQRIGTAAPGAVFDDHAAWLVPLVVTAERLRAFAWACLGLIALAFVASAGLAARAALSAFARDIRTLRLVGARDRFIAGALTRRLARRALAGAALGTAAGLGLVAVLPVASEPGFFLVGIGLRGWPLALPLTVPVAALVLAWLATARAVRRELRSGS
jgi:cell division transport system permease protein